MKYLIGSVCGAAVMWWSGGSWGWGAAAFMYGWAITWILSQERV